MANFRPWPLRRLAVLLSLLTLPAALAQTPPALRGLVDADDGVEPSAEASAGAHTPSSRGYSPNAGRSYPMRVYFGVTQLHTSNSGDAFMGGDRLGPEQAYRFARGEEVVSSTGLPAKLGRPLDFLVITDHAEGLGLMAEAANEVVVAQFSNTLPPLLKDPKVVGPVMRSVWTQSTALAEKDNEPGHFTALIGYEWTSVPGGNNLHRNVIFRDGKARADQVFPFAAWNSEDPEKLWEWMEGYEPRTGGRLLAIPHNANLSNGRIFEPVTFSGAALTADYARRRARWEPLQEIIQTKGNSETHPTLSPNDEFAGSLGAYWAIERTLAMLGGP